MNDKQKQKRLKKIGAAIRAKRIALDLSMNKLAQRSGLSQPMIGLIERAEHDSHLTTYMKVANGLGTTLAQLLDDAGV